MLRPAPIGSQGKEIFNNPETPLPPASMHDPEEVSNFVLSYLRERGESSRPIGLQIVAIKAYHNVELVQRFLTDLERAREESSWPGELKVFILDDSPDDNLAQQIERVAKEHGVDYERVRSSTGIAARVFRRMRDKIIAEESSPSKRRYRLWLLRALFKDGLQVPLVDPENFILDDPKKSLGGIAGSQNVGYLRAVYEAGRAGVPLKEVTVTVNEDDQRYQMLVEEEENIRAIKHDYFAERAAWFLDGETEAVVGRYTGHTGNPISLVRDTLEIVQEILEAWKDGRSEESFIFFNPKDDTFEQTDAQNAFLRLRDILVAAVQRRPIVGLWTTKKYLEKATNWQETTKLDLGNVTLRGSAVMRVPAPLGGIFDYNLTSQLRALALQKTDPNRAVRREAPIMHQRAPRKHGGDAFGTSMKEAFTNPFSLTQLKILQVIRENPSLQEEITAILGLPNKESFQNLVLRTFTANGEKLEEIQTLRDNLWNQVQELKTNSSLNDEEREALSSLEDFLRNFTAETIKEIKDNLDNPFRSGEGGKPEDAEDIEEEKMRIEREKRRILKGIRRYIRAYQLWPEVIEMAYQMGREDQLSGSALEQGEAIPERAKNQEKREVGQIPVGVLPGVLAHSGRPYEVALELVKEGLGVEIDTAIEGEMRVDFRDLPPTEGVKIRGDGRYYFHPGELIRGELTVKELAQNVASLARELKENPPPFILADHNVPLALAARLAGIPVVSITNMSNVAFMHENCINALGPLASTLYKKYYLPLEPKLQALWAEASHAFNGQKNPPLNWWQIMEGGDLILVADNPFFVDQELGGINLRQLLASLSSGAKLAFVGSIQPRTLIARYEDAEATSEAVSRLEQARREGRKIIFGSFGSIQKTNLFQALIELAQRRNDYLVMITTGGAELGNLPPNLKTVRFAQLPQLAQQADVLFCQGGSGTLYPFLKYGRGGIIAIPTNADQKFNSFLLQMNKMGAEIPLLSLTPEKLSQTVEGLLERQDEFLARRQQLAPLISLDGARRAAKIISQTYSL